MASINKDQDNSSVYLGNSISRLPRLSSTTGRWWRTFLFFNPSVDSKEAYVFESLYYRLIQCLL